MLDGSLSSQITAIVLALAGEIEREFIAAWTKEMLRQKQAAGLERRLVKAKRLGKRAIAKLCECSPETLYTWLERRRPGVLISEA